MYLSEQHIFPLSLVSVQSKNPRISCSCSCVAALLTLVVSSDKAQRKPDTCPFSALRTFCRMTISTRGHVSSHSTGCCGLCDTKALQTRPQVMLCLEQSQQSFSESLCVQQLSSLNPYSHSQNVPNTGKAFCHSHYLWIFILFIVE